MRHVSQGFSLKCKHCAVEKNVLILVEWLHSENVTGSFCALTAKKQLYCDKIETRVVGFLRLKTKKARSRREDTRRQVEMWIIGVLVRRP